MGELIELSYRHFPPLVIEKLIRNGYLRFSDRHKPEAVKRAWNRLRQHTAAMIAAAMTGDEGRKTASQASDRRSDFEVS